MARLITGGREGMINHMFGAMSSRTTDYLQEQIYTLSEKYGERANQFVERIQRSFNRTTGRLMNAARNTLNYSRGYFRDNISLKSSIEEFRFCNPLEQRYLSSLGAMQDLIEKGRIEGWNRAIVGHPKGELNPYYRAAIDGMYTVEGDIPGETFEGFRIHFNDYEDYGIEELEMNEKIVIQHNWRQLHEYLTSHDEDAQDPTSIEGGYL